MYDEGTTNATYKYGVIVNEGFKYTFHFTQLPTKREILYIMDYGRAGDLATTVYKGLGNLAGFRLQGHQITLNQVNSIAAVESATDHAYFIAGNGDVYLRTKAINRHTRTNIFFKWDGQGSYQPSQVSQLPCVSSVVTGISDIDSDGDGMSDIDEGNVCRAINNAGDLNFEFNKSDELFTRTNIAASNTSSEVAWLTRVDQSNDPYVVRGGLNFNGSEIPQLRIRAKSEATGSFQLFWTTTDQPGFAAARSITVAPQQTNVYEELVFDMSNNQDWMGKKITQIRLDFPPDVTTNRHTWIDYVHGPDASPDGNCGGPLSTDQFGNSNKLKLYPNPAQNTLFISGNTGDKLIKVYDVLGAVQITKTFKDGETEMDLSGLSTGLYLVRITNLTGKSDLEEVHRILKTD